MNKEKWSEVVGVKLIPSVIVVGYNEVPCAVLEGGARIPLGMDSDQIIMESNTDNTIYYILIQIQIRIRILSHTNAKRMS